MSIIFKIKRGTASQNNLYTGKKGELTMVTDSGSESVRIHDGDSQGGFELARNDLINVTTPVGGVIFEFQYDTNTNNDDSDPGNGFIQFDNNAIASATKLHISTEDRLGNSVDDFLASTITTTQGIFGHFRIFKKSDPNNFRVFKITATPESVGTPTHSYKYTN